MYYQFINNRCHYRRFTSLEDITDYAHLSWAGFTHNRKLSLDEDFIGRSFCSINEVIKASHSRWDEGMAIFDRMLKQLKNEHLQPPQNIKRQAVWSEEQGDDLCLDRLRHAQPYWRTTKRNHRPGPINVTIISSLATPSYVSPKNVLWRGAACVCLTMLLEQASYRVELLVGHHSTKNAYRSSNNHSLNVLELKHCEDPLDESTLINAISAWFYRTVFFVASYQKGETKHSSLMGEAGILSPIINCITPDLQAIICEDIWSEYDAVNWIKQQLAKFANGEFASQT